MPDAFRRLPQRPFSLRCYADAASITTLPLLLRCSPLFLLSPLMMPAPLPADAAAMLRFFAYAIFSDAAFFRRLITTRLSLPADIDDAAFAAYFRCHASRH